MFRLLILVCSLFILARASLAQTPIRVQFSPESDATANLGIYSEDLETRIVVSVAIGEDTVDVVTEESERGTSFWTVAFLGDDRYSFRELPHVLHVVDGLGAKQGSYTLRLNGEPIGTLTSEDGKVRGFQRFVVHDPLANDELHQRAIRARLAKLSCQAAAASSKARVTFFQRALP